MGTGCPSGGGIRAPRSIEDATPCTMQRCPVQPLCHSALHSESEPSGALLLTSSVIPPPILILFCWEEDCRLREQDKVGVEQAQGDAMGNAQSAGKPKPTAPRRNMQTSAAVVARSFPSDESGQGPKVRSPFSGLMIAATPSRLVRPFFGSLHCPNPFLLHVLVRWTLIIAGANALAHQHADTSKQCPATEASLTSWH